MKNYIFIISIVFLVSCNSTPSISTEVIECKKNTVYEQLDCSMQNLDTKERLLDHLGNKSRSDYQDWLSSVESQCEENNLDETMGESISDSLECKHKLYDKRISLLKKTN